jgi:hypothetical protein
MKRLQFLPQYLPKYFLKRRINSLHIAHLLAVVAISIASCTKLDENPKSFISEDNYYKTKNDADAAVNAIYYALNGPNGTQVPYNVLFVTGMDFMSDDVLMSLGATNPDVKVQSTLDHTPAALRVKEIWQQHYVAINRANIAIDKIPSIPYNNSSDSAILKRLVLEAKFLRGFYYLNLVRLFGGVPLVLHETTSLSKQNLLVSRASADTIYNQVIKDFTEAENLPWYYPSGDANAGRATGAAAKGFLSLIYLTRANINEDDRPANVSTIATRPDYLQKAIDKSNEIIKRSNKYYDLFDDYADVFKKSSKNGKEHLFSAQFKSNANKHGNSYAQRNAALGIKDKSGVTVVNGTLGDAPTTDLLSKFRSVDKRTAVILTSTYTVNGTTYTIDKAQNAGFSQVINKYYDPDVPANLIESGINVPILKYSEILLINAEANNELNGPNDEAHLNYNKIRKRAGLSEFTLGSLSKDQFRDSLYLDLRIEDTHEYKRWFDLIREIDKDGNHIMVKTLRAVGKPAAADKHYLYPIPQTEIDINSKLTQNPGW